MKRILSLLLMLSIAVSLCCCEAEPDVTVCVSEKYSDAAAIIIDALKAENISCKLISDMEEAGESELIVVGYFENEDIGKAVSNYNIHDCCAMSLGSFVYIGGRSDCPDTDVCEIAQKFVAENIVGKKEYLGCQKSLEILDGHSLDLASINGKPISDFKIVYSQTDGNTGKNKLIADYLQQQISLLSGKELVVMGDVSNEFECEIYIGKCRNRVYSEVFEGEEFSDDSMAYSIAGTKVAIRASDDLYGYMAASEFIDLIERAQNTEFNGETSYKKENVDFIKVACVGDSITEGGAGLYNYPAYLQQMIGFDYHVINCGKSGYSTRVKDPYPYIATVEYSTAIKFKPDVVIYMLGTNDCQPTKDWSETTKKEYKESANRIFDALEEANPDVQIFVVLPPSLFENNVWNGWERWSQQVKDYAVPLNRELAEERGYTIIDAYTWSLSHSEVFKDGLHPGEETYCDFAQCIYNGIIGSIKKAK